MKRPIPKFTIEKDVPYPKKISVFSVLRETLLKMKVGDSFLYPYDRRQPLLIAKRMKIKITTSKENGNGSRVWRIK